MNKLWEIWKDGGWVLLRWLWFSFILGLISLPLRLVLITTVNHSLYGNQPAYIPIGMIIAALVVIMPLLLYVVSEWTGEFVAPRINRKKLAKVTAGSFFRTGQNTEKAGPAR